MTIAEVYMHGTRIGVVTLKDGERYARFQYAPDFVESEIEVSPFMMPLSKERIYEFPALSLETFLGLPGMLVDSLPDSFGQAIIEAWLARQGREITDFNAVERLCYTGKRGMGALEYRPATGPRIESEPIEIDALVELASEIMEHREQISVKYKTAQIDSQAFSQIMQIGTSAGGARAKAIIAWNRKTHEIKSGQINAGKDFEYYIMKFDGVKGNRDKEGLDGEGYTNIEYAYYLMASDAGIEMSACELLQDRKLNHFITKRFDRDESGRKIHMQSLGGLVHYDFNQAGVNSYEQVFRIIQRLQLGAKTREQFFLRIVFNIYAINRDDHVKNISFLMDRKGKWFLSPAYDITYSYNPYGNWTKMHQMTVNGKRKDITKEDLLTCANKNGIKEQAAQACIDRVKEVLKNWEQYAKKAKIKKDHQDRIGKHLIENMAELEA